MSNRSNPEYLRNDQYRDAGNLNSRINLHYHFSTNPADWFRWVFDHFNLPARASVLEIGCGPARLWVGNLDRFPSAWQIFLSDFSLGMLLAARSNLVQHTFPFNYSALDAQAIPFPPATFDLVVANHMLYHVPDIQQALKEIRRVLKPGGRLLVLEFSKPVLPGLNAVYDAYSFHLLPKLGKLIANDEDSYRYLVESIRKHPDQETLKGMMEKAGFERTHYFNLSGGIVALHKGYKF